jgi:hypothetical protein
MGHIRPPTTELPFIPFYLTNGFLQRSANPLGALLKPMRYCKTFIIHTSFQVMLRTTFVRSICHPVGKRSMSSLAPVYATQLQQECALRQIACPKVSLPTVLPVSAFRIPGPPPPKCERECNTLQVTWHKEPHVNSYSLRHVGQSTRHYWQEISEDAFDSEDESTISHSVEVAGTEGHLVQIRAHFGDFKSEWSTIEVVMK